METTRLLPRLNLVRHNVVHVGFSCSLEWEEVGAGLFQDLLDEPEAGEAIPISDLAELVANGSRSVMSFTKYRRSSTEHLISETVVHSDVPGRLHIDVTYDVNRDNEVFPPGAVPTEWRREGMVFGRLLRLHNPVTLRCHAHFTYDPDDPTRIVTVFPLPARLPGDTRNIPFDEIRGFRGVKLVRGDEEAIEYNFVLDRPNNAGVYLTINFSHETVIGSSSPTDVLDRATAIARRLVSLRGERTEQST